MRIICDGIDLCDAVGKVIKAIGVKKLLPILEGIKLEARDNKLILTATDNELTIIKEINAQVRQEGTCVVVGKLFSDFIRRLDNEQIELDYRGGANVKISFGDNTGSIACYNYMEFPKTPLVDTSESFSIVKKELKDIFSKVYFCVSKTEERVIFQGVFMEIQEYAVNAVAIDGTRLAQASKPIEQKTAQMSMIVPSKFASEINKILEESEEIITIYKTKNVIMADLGHTKIYSKLIEGEFINYKYIYPVGIKTTIKVSREKLLNALDRCSVVMRRDSIKEVKMEMRENMLTLQSNSEDGTIKEIVPVALEGKDMNIAFNAAFFIDVLGILKDDYVKIEFNDNINPCVIRPISGEEYSYLILPTRQR